MIHFQWSPFLELPVENLYAALVLRSNIFVVEQCCPYLDPDGNDTSAIHLLGKLEGSLIAYLRLFPPTNVQNHLVFGRVAIAKSVRRQGYGKKLMRELLNYCHLHFPGVPIHCSAQFYLKEFYEGFGFKICSDVYDEDGIPHIQMQSS